MSRAELKSYIQSELMSNGKLKSRKMNYLPADIDETIHKITKKCQGTMGERIYWVLNDMDDYPKCLVCGKSVTKHYKGLNKGYVTQFCSPICSNGSSLVREKIKQTNLKRYGVENPSQNKEIQEQMTQTMVDRYGGKRMLQTLYGRDNFNRVMTERYGTNNANYSVELRSKRTTTMINKYGVTNALQLIEQREQGMLAKYGVRHNMHVLDILERSHKIKTKRVQIDADHTINLMGYEGVAFRFLITECDYVFDDIVWKRKDIPRIRYSVEGKLRIYYPDLWIPKSNLFIEVKSTWTWSKNIEKNQLKIQATINAGYNIEVWICDGVSVLEKIKGTEVPFISKLPVETRS